MNKFKILPIILILIFTFSTIVYSKDSNFSKYYIKDESGIIFIFSARLNISDNDKWKITNINEFIVLTNGTDLFAYINLDIVDYLKLIISKNGTSYIKFAYYTPSQYEMIVQKTLPLDNIDSISDVFSIFYSSLGAQ